MKRSHILAAIAAAALSIPMVGAIALAQPYSRMLDRLNLSEDQRESIEAIVQQSRSRSEQQRQQLQAARERMRSLMTGNASAEQLRQQHNEVQRLQQALGEQRFETMLQIRNELTPEQRAQFNEFGPRGEGRGEGRGGRRGGMGRGANGPATAP